MKTKAVKGKWMSAHQAGKLLGIDTVTFQRLAKRTPITTLGLPGLPVRYSRADVEAIARNSIGVSRPRNGEHQQITQSI